MGNAPVPLSPLSQRMINETGSFAGAKQQIGNSGGGGGGMVTSGRFKSPGMNMVGSSPAHMERGGSASGSLFPVQDIGGGKGVGVVGGGMHGPLRQVVTGGYGAMPARAGRIGYRGTLQERPGVGKNQSGLAGFYAMQREAELGKANLAKTNPVTGLSFNPTDRDISAQMKMVGEKYGPTEVGMLGDYYNYGRTGDFARQQQAADRIMNRRQELNKPTTVAPTNTGGQNPQGIPVNQAMSKLNGMVDMFNAPAEPKNYVEQRQNAGQMASFGGPSAQNYATSRLEHGGATDSVKPYIVNEKGEEAWQPDGEKPQLIPGKEKMVLFPKDGKVIPHGRTMEMAKKGQVEMPEHRAVGGENKGSQFPRPQKNISSFGKDGKESGHKPKTQVAQPRKNLSKLEPLSEQESGLLADLISRARHTPEWASRLNPGQWIQGAESEIPERVRQELGLPATYEGQGIGGEVANRIAAENEAIRSALDAGKFENISHTLESGRRIPQIAMVQKPQIPGLEEATAPMTRVATVPVGQGVLPPPDAIVDNDWQASKQPNLIGDVLTKSQGPAPTIENAAWKASEQPALLGETLSKVASPTPEQIKTQQGYTPEEQDLLTKGQQMTERGISQMGPNGVKFASGGGIENGQAFGPHVIQPENQITIKPGHIKDELGDVGTRLAKQKEDKEFMKRWENDENMGRTSQMAQKREDGGPVKSGTSMMNSPIPKPPIFNIEQANPFLQAVGQWSDGQPFPLPPNAPGVGGHYPLSAYGAFKTSPEAWVEAIQQQAAMEKYAKEAMAARNQRRGRTKSFAK